MADEKRHRKVLSAALEAKDTLDSLFTATCLLIAAKAEIDRLVEIEPANPRRVCERAGFLLSRFHEQELIPAMNTIDKALDRIASESHQT